MGTHYRHSAYSARTTPRTALRFAQPGEQRRITPEHLPSRQSPLANNRRANPLTMRAVMAALLYTLLAAVSGMDVSWTPSDPNDPLPNSKAYLDKLGRLCELLKQDKLPPKPPQRTIAIQCAKLKEKMA